jgi:hypothetical protein
MGDQEKQHHWWHSDFRFRLPITVDPNRYERYDKPVEVLLDFAKHLTALGESEDLNPEALRVVEINERGKVIDGAVAYQFDPDAHDDPANQAKGTLVFVLKGTTRAHARRRFHIYFDTVATRHSPRSIPPQVALTESVQDEGQDSFKIATQNATYYYHKLGAGFSSMVDVDGHDWLGYRPGGGSAGEYRGIPNMGHPEGYCHPGKEVSNSWIVGAGPLRVSILSASDDGKMRCRWDIFPRYARLTILKMRTPYWFLYEGTPGGNPGGMLDEENGYCVRSTGERTPIGQRWEGDIPDPEWLYFGAGTTKRVIYLVHHEDDEAVDSYWPMEHNMTVFGFGRSGLNKYMERVPAHFTVGFAENGDFEEAAKVIDSTFRDLDVRTDKPEIKTER